MGTAPGSNRVVGFAPGVYDLFHVGHLNILERAKRECDHLIAGVTSDELCLEKKGHLPYVPLAERVAIVREISYVDEVVVEVLPDSPFGTWREIGFDVIFKGDDCRGTRQWRGLERDFAKAGVQVVYFPYTVHTSSTLLAAALSRAVPGWEQAQSSPAVAGVTAR